MKTHRLLSILRIDLKRAFLSYKFLFSILLGIGICYFTLLFCGNYKSETIHKFVMLHDRSQSFLAYIAGIIAYALCFYEDFLYGNIKNVAGRIRLKEYVFSKTAAAILSTIAAFVLGKLCFAMLYSINNPISRPETLTRLSPSMMYFDLIRSGHYISYFFFTSFQKALYCAVLCQAVMLVSLLIPDKAVVLSLPIAVFYVFHFYINTLMKDDFFNLSRIFDGITKIFDNDWYGLSYAVLIAFILYWCLYRLTLYLVQRKVHHE